MMTTRILHEGGLSTISPLESRHLFDNHGLRPVMAIEGRTNGDLDLLLSKAGVPLGLQVSALYSAPTGSATLLWKTFALAYDLGAAVYHCGNLTKVYASIVTHYNQIRSIEGLLESESDVAGFSYQTEPYYELDALLSASRRAYDKIGHCLWQAFGGGGGMPDNISELLERLTTCPELLKERLRGSWKDVGARLKDYRDCTQHFASTDLGMGHVTMRRLANGSWVAWARIPDNPETKSKKKFTYAGGHDALTYGWEVVNEVSSLATEVVAVAAASVSPRALAREGEPEGK